MISISQTDYIDFLSRSGVSKFSKVKSLFNRSDYHPAFDFYKNLRDALVAFSKKEKDRAELYSFITTQNPKKQNRFGILLDGYFRFLGRKKAEFLIRQLDIGSTKTFQLR